MDIWELLSHTHTMTCPGLRQSYKWDLTSRLSGQCLYVHCYLIILLCLKSGNTGGNTGVWFLPRSTSKHLNTDALPAVYSEPEEDQGLSDLLPTSYSCPLPRAAQKETLLRLPSFSPHVHHKINTQKERTELTSPSTARHIIRTIVYLDYLSSLCFPSKNMTAPTFLSPIKKVLKLQPPDPPWGAILGLTGILSH